MISKRRWPSINILKVYEKWSYAEWNSFLTKCYHLEDVTRLEKTLYGIQAGMDDLSRHGRPPEEIINTFLRWQRSIEQTVNNVPWLSSGEWTNIFD